MSSWIMLTNSFATTKGVSAEAHDSKVLEALLTENTSKDVWADSAYCSEKEEASLKTKGHRSHIHKKGHRNHPLSERDQHANRKKSTIRSRVEPVFGFITNEPSGLNFKVIGFARICAKIGLRNLVYNMRRLVTLHEMRLSTDG